MLDTVLSIGKAFRNSPNALKHNQYILKCPLDTDKSKVLRLSIPVTKDFNFDFNELNEITDENVIVDKLFYLKFKTADADGLVKYIWGDIFYTLTKGAEGGYYRLGDPNNKQKAYRLSSFDRGNGDFQDIVSIHDQKKKESVNGFSIGLFRKEFATRITLNHNLLKYQQGIKEALDQRRDGKIINIVELLSDEDKLLELTALRGFKNIKGGKIAKRKFKEIIKLEEPEWDTIMNVKDTLLKLAEYSTGQIFLHFDFNGKHWYDFPMEFEIITEKMLKDFVEPALNGKGFILKKSLYKTLSSPEKDWQFPSFDPNKRYRSKVFDSLDQISDLAHAIRYSETGLTVPKTEIKIIILPKGVNLSSEHYEQFSDRFRRLEDAGERGKILNEQNKPDSVDFLFRPVLENVASNITQFDLIFSKKGGLTSPDVDLVEISGIEKSKLQEISERIRRIKAMLYEQRAIFFTKELKPLSIHYCFLNILGDSTKAKKKYQSHLLKVLPLIYSGTYYRDPLLLPLFIEKTEEMIRDPEIKFNFNLFKFDFYFLIWIQNVQKEGDNLMKITESHSYELGLLLGKLAQPLIFEIKAFEKSYVGNLTRRIATLPDLIKFKSFIEEKLVIHEKNYPQMRETSLDLTENIKNFESRYDKNECAFGFFESYFAPFESNKTKTQEQTTVE